MTNEDLGDAIRDYHRRQEVSGIYIVINSSIIIPDFEVEFSDTPLEIYSITKRRGWFSPDVIYTMSKKDIHRAITLWSDLKNWVQYEGNKVISTSFNFPEHLFLMFRSVPLGSYKKDYLDEFKGKLGSFTSSNP